MKKLMIAAAAVVLLSGTVSAVNARTYQHSHMKAKHAAHMQHRRAVTTDGYSVSAPTRDPGRYSNLPGKDGVSSKAYIQDH